MCWYFKETKLVKNDETPRFPGFAVERKNREQPPGEENNRGGGLMIGIKDNIPYTYMSKTNIRGKKDHITESQTNMNLPQTKNLEHLKLILGYIKMKN